MRKLILAAGLFASLPAFPAPLSLVVPMSFCGDARKLQSAAKGCEDNAAFARKAKDCLGLLSVEAKKLNLDIKSLQRQGTKSQQGDMKLAAKEYFELTQKLDYIIGLTEVARIDAFNFREHMIRPEDDEDEKEVMAAECFGGNIKSLMNTANEMEKQQIAWEAVLEITKKKLMETQANARQMENMGSLVTSQPLPQATPSKPAPAPKGPKGKNWNASDISGTEKKKE
jgi:hypothetical protein